MTLITDYSFVLENIESFIGSSEDNHADGEDGGNNYKVEDRCVKPLELDFIVDLPPITAEYLVIVKLTAHFVAINVDHDVLDESYKKVKWNEANKINDSKLKENEEVEKLGFASIDWQGFVIVETIDITEIDSHTEFPLLLTFSDLRYRTLEAKSQDFSVPNVTLFTDDFRALSKSHNMKIFISLEGDISMIKRWCMGIVV